eukprot:TRINITY_DN3392_c0_g4_i3.p1 TRINITY_DN3392_c0_g4~~TRINITY_DN3392_c0_g4_i3.p1  ORF type:complete len:889 (-),score=320.04 TRINITY_DN3392_c0_g4_i3:432-3098(-)
MKLRFGDFATRRELRAVEDRLNAAVQDKITEDMKVILQKIADMGKVQIEDQRLMGDRIMELNKKLVNLEHQQDNKIVKCQSHADARVKEVENEMKKAVKEMKEELGKLREEVDIKFESNKVEVFNAITQKNTQQFNEYEQILENFRQAIKDNSERIQMQDAEVKKNQKHVDGSVEKLTQRNAAIIKQLKTLRANQEEIMKRLEMDLHNKLGEYEKRSELDKKQAEKEMKGMADEIAELRSGVTELGKSQRKEREVREFATKRKASDADGKIAEIQQELDDFNEKLKSLLQLEQRFEERMSTMEESLDSRCEKRCQSLQTTCNSSSEKLHTQFVVLEQSISHINQQLAKLEKTASKHSQTLSNTNNNLKDLGNSHNDLTKRVEVLERRLDSLIAELRKKLGDCAKEFQVHREAIIELMDRETPEPVYELAIRAPEPKEPTEEKQDITEEKPKEVNNVLIGTDNFMRNIELQTDVQPEVKPEKKSMEAAEPIFEKDYKRGEAKESSRVYSEGAKVESEAMSEEEDGPRLNRLQAKTPRQVALEERKEDIPEIREMTLDLTIPKKSPTVFDEMSQQTDRHYMSEAVRERAVRAPTVSKDLFSNSPHYLREDPLRSIDRRRIISTKGVKVQDNISSKHFRKSQMFAINLDDIANIGQDDYHRATYSEFIDYASMNFDNYEPQVDHETSTFKRTSQFEPRNSKKVNAFRTGYTERENNLAEIEENQIHESARPTPAREELSQPLIVEPEHEPERRSHEVAEENPPEEAKHTVVPARRECGGEESKEAGGSNSLIESEGNVPQRASTQSEPYMESAHNKAHECKLCITVVGGTEESKDEKLRKVMDVNKESMKIYEEDRKRMREESQKMFSDKGYIVGPNVQDANGLDSVKSIE